jgi:hypothetical protein
MLQLVPVNAQMDTLMLDKMPVFNVITLVKHAQIQLLVLLVTPPLIVLSQHLLQNYVRVLGAITMTELAQLVEPVMLNVQLVPFWPTTVPHVI